MTTIFGLSILDFGLLVLQLAESPILAWAIYKFISFLNMILAVRTGSIRIWKQLPNDQVTKFFSRPEGGKIKIKTRNPGGILNTTTIEVNLGKGWIWREGGVPFILLDKDNNQVPWKVNYVSEGVPKEIIDEVADTAYQSGTMVGFGNLKSIKTIMTFIIIVMVMIGINYFLTYYFVNNIHIVTQAVNVIAANTTTSTVV